MSTLKFAPAARWRTIADPGAMIPSLPRPARAAGIMRNVEAGTLIAGSPDAGWTQFKRKAKTSLLREPHGVDRQLALRPRRHPRRGVVTHPVHPRVKREPLRLREDEKRQPRRIRLRQQQRRPVHAVEFEVVTGAQKQVFLEDERLASVVAGQDRARRRAAQARAPRWARVPRDGHD